MVRWRYLTSGWGLAHKLPLSSDYFNNKSRGWSWVDFERKMMCRAPFLLNTSQSHPLDQSNAAPKETSDWKNLWQFLVPGLFNYKFTICPDSKSFLNFFQRSNKYGLINVWIFHLHYLTIFKRYHRDFCP